MSDQFVWDGSVLRGPIDTNDYSVALPVGSVSAAPLDTPGWRVSFNKIGGGVYIFYLGNPSPSVIQPNTFVWVRIASPRAPTSPSPIDFIIGKTDFEERGLCRVLPDYEAHHAAKWRLEMSVLRDRTGPAAPSPAPPTHIPTIAAHLRHLTQSPIPFDIRLSFPRSGQDLWASSIILKKASPYFNDLLTSGFAESQPETCSYVGPTTAQSGPHDPSWSDSDGEVQVVATSTQTQHPIFSTKITDYSFATYQAVWIWILTQHITFSPLQSSASKNPPLASQSSVTIGPPTKRHKTTQPAADAGNNQAGVSPKSVYRLSHLLGLDKLQQLAFGAFRKDLTVDNVAAQLFSSTADLHDDIREAAAKFAVDHWTQVEQTAEMKDKMAQVAAREVDQGGVVMQTLAVALASKLRET